MAATVEVNVKVNDAAALTQLSNLDTKIDELNRKSVNINVNTTGGTGGGLEGAAEDAKDLSENTQEANFQLGRFAKNAVRVGAAVTVAFAVKSVKQALNTMKEVDSELANIRKVTGESAEYIAELGNRAYDTASKYGVSAKELLSSAAEFAKAGYSNYEQLAELAIKTQLVGDVSDSVATKFLLSADAAYKFGGNIKSISTVLDKANVIENNYATSIQKIAEGLPRVASTAAMTNMTIDELMAAIGTITAVTQESGSKSATALRALIMNITGVTGTIQDVDGEIRVTEEDTTLLRNAIAEYGNAAMKAAVQAGEVLDPIEAMRSLYLAYKAGEFNPRELFGELMGLGGKLRTNQLAALIENFDMFEEMLGLVENSAGSADAEVEVMLNTWQAKVNQLNNTWTEFVSHIADTSAIKGAIETLTSLIDGLDQALLRLGQNQFERAQADQKKIEQSYDELFGKNGTYRAEMDALASHYNQLNEFEKQRLSWLYQQEAAMRSQVKDAQDLTQAKKLQYLNEIIESDEYNDYGDKVLYSRAEKQLKDFQKAFNEAIVEDGSKNRQEIAAALTDTINSYKEFYDIAKELSDAGEDIGTFATKFLEAYEEALNMLPDAVQKAKEETKSLAEPVEVPVVAKPTEGLAPEHGSAKAVEEAIQAQVTEPVEVDVPVQFNYDIDNAKSGAEQDALEVALRQKLEDAAEKAGEDSEVEVRIEGIDESTDDIDGLIDTISEIPGITEVQFEDNALVCKGQVDALHEAVTSLPTSKTITITIVTEGSIPDVPGHAKGTKNAPGGLSLVNEKGPELISDNGRAYIANGGKPAIVNLGKGAIVLTAEETRQALGGASIYNGINAYAGGFNGVPSIAIMYTDGGSNASKIPAVHALVKNITKSSSASQTSTPPKKNNSSSNGSGGSGGSKDSGGGGGSSKSKWDDKEEKLKDELDALDELAEWYHNQKKHEDEQNTYQKAIEKLDALRKEYLEAGFDETSKEVTTLANKIYDYEKEIADAKAHAIDDLEDELDNLESQIKLAENQGDLNRMLELQNEAQKKVADLIEAYRAAGFSDTSPEILKLANMGYGYASDSGSTMKDLWKNLITALEDMRDTQEDANDLAEKQLAVDEAREALQNAQNQRTVRIFNPITGQWEWVADSKSVQQAQEKLTSAEEALLKEQQSQELAALKNVMENGGSLSDVNIGPGLSALLSGASLEQTNAFASALGLLTGGLASTADTSAKSIFDSVDSHDNVTQYTFNGVTIDAATAENMTLAELTQLITPLALTNNMPA